MKVLLLFLAIFSMKSYARFADIECEKQLKFRKTYVDDKVEAPCRELNHINEVFLSIDKFANSNKRLTIFLDKESYNASVSISGLILLSNRQKGWNEVRNLQKSKVIWAHEYGHVVFNDLMVKEFTPIKAFQRYMVEHDKFSIKKRKPLSDNFQRAKDYWSSEAELGRDIQKPYSELFADLIATLYAQNKSTMRDAMVVKGMDARSLELAKYYSFDENIGIGEYKGNDIHFVFGPVKSFIGKKLLKFPMSDQRKLEVVNVVSKAIFKELNRLWDNKLRPKNFDILNRKLIEALSKNTTNN